MEEEKNILLVVDGAPKVNFAVTKNNTVADLKNILKRYLSKGNDKITFFINDQTTVPVFDSNQYDKLSLTDVWDKMTKPHITVSLNFVPQKDVALTGIKDLDFIILQNISDQDLGNFCRMNKEARKLCTDDTFWRNRTINRFSSVIPHEILIKNKESNFKTWREYYINLVDFLEKIYLGFLMGKEYTIRDDIMILRNIVVENSEKLNNLENVKKTLAENFVDPNYFFDENNYFYSSNQSSDEEFRRREKIEAVILIGSDSRFRPARVLPLLLDNLSGNLFKKDDEYEDYLRVLSPYFTKELILDILYKKIEKGECIAKLKGLLLPFAVEKGARKKDIKRLLKATFHGSDRYTKGCYEYAIDDIKEFIKKMK